MSEENGEFIEEKVEVEERYVSPEMYHELIGLDDCPDLSAFPDGIYILGPKGWANPNSPHFGVIKGFYPESQIDKMEGLVIG